MVLRYRQVSDTPATVIAGEAAVVTPGDQRLHLLDEVGTEVWQLCADDGCSLEELTARLVERYDGDPQVIEQETRAFLEDAVSRGLLEAVEREG